MISFHTFVTMAVCVVTGGAVRSYVQRTQQKLVDMTGYFNELKAKEATKGSRSGKTIVCCCDLPKTSALSGFFSHLSSNQSAGHSGRCIIAKAKGCSKMEVDWIGTRSLSHSGDTKEGTCMIQEADVQSLFTLFGSPERYCASIPTTVSFVDATVRRLGSLGSANVVDAEAGSPKVDSASLGASSPVQCPPGFVPEVQTVTCTYYDHLVGVFDPVPGCKKVEAWCPGFDTTAEEMWQGRPWVPSAEVNTPVEVHCAPGFSPFPTKINCGVDKNLSPMPMCALTDKFCRKTVGSSVSGIVDEDAKLGEWQLVRCLNAGEVPADGYVQCGYSPDFSAGAWVPEPSCRKNFEHCPAVVASSDGYVRGEEPHIREAALGHTVLVECRKGARPNFQQVKCAEDGHFYGYDWQTPTCTPIPDWCGPINEFTDEYRVYVPAAARNKMSPVECPLGFKAKPEAVFCETNREFNEKPTCVKL